MQFLNPFVLIGLIAAGVPILLHFLSRRRVIDIPFAPLRFLKPSQERQMRRMNLRRLLLLILRVLIVSLVVMAVAKPTLTGGLASLVRGGEGVSVVVLVDDSASTQRQVEGGTVFDRVREEAEELAAGLGPDDEVLVALFSDTVRPLFAEFVRRPSLVTAELAGVEPGTRPSDYLGALDSALDLLQRATHGHREIHLIGDLQVAEIDTTRRSALTRRFAEEPSTRIYLRGVSVDPFVNRQVEPVEVPAAMLRAQETTAIGVRVRQDGDEALRVPLFLSVDEVTVGETELEIPARSSGEYSFPLTLPGEGSLGASARVRPDRYPLDDEAWFVLDVNETIETLVLRGVEGETGERDPLLFLNAALDPEQQVPGRFHPRVVDAARFDPVDLQKVGVVIAVDPRDLGSARLSVLSDYLEQGGTLLAFVGDPRVRTYLNDRLLPAWGALRLGSFRGDEEVFERLEVAAPDHPVFEGLEPDALATIEEVRLRNFYRIEGEADRVLLRYAGGGTAAAEIEVGLGRVILCGFDTAAVSGDLPWSPMFLPLVQRLTGYLATAGWGRFGRHFDTGQPLVVAAPEGIGASEEWTLVAPDGSRTRAELDASALPPRVRHAGVAVPGVYRFERDGEAVTSIAVNVPRNESTPASWNTEDFAAAMGGGTDRVRWGSLDGEDAAQALRDARTGHGVHRWFLWIALFLLAIESLISRRVGTTSAATSERPAT